MPVPIPEALAEASNQAATKAGQVRRPARYLTSSALAGAYVGIAVVLLASVSGPLLAADSPWAKLVQGAVFGIALTLVVFAGAELFTGNAMVMIQGVMDRAVRPGQLAAVWAMSLFGNLIGSIGFAALVHGGGTLSAGPGEALITSVVDAKNGLAGPQLLWRSVLCNLLVCLALWMAGRTKNDGAKLIVLWWALLAFIASGYEHSVANMTIFGIGVLQGSADWGDLARNLLWTVPGNVIGGGVLVGAVYGWIGRPVPVPASAPPRVPTAVIPAVEVTPEAMAREGSELLPQVR